MSLNQVFKFVYAIQKPAEVSLSLLAAADFHFPAVVMNTESWNEVTPDMQTTCVSKGD